jgi:hypothetical protein
MSAWEKTRLGDMSAAIKFISLEIHRIELNGTLNAWEVPRPEERRAEEFLTNF